MRFYSMVLQTPVAAAEARFITGVAFAAQKRWREAIPLYEAALRLKPDFAEAHYRLGLALAATGKKSEARPHLQQALSLATSQNNPVLAENIRDAIKTCPASLPLAPTP